LVWKERPALQKVIVQYGIECLRLKHIKMCIHQTTALMAKACSQNERLFESSCPLELLSEFPQLRNLFSLGFVFLLFLQIQLAKCVNVELVNVVAGARLW